MKDDCKNEDDEKKKNKEKGISKYDEMNTTYYPFMLKTANIFNLSNPTI